MHRLQHALFQSVWGFVDHKQHLLSAGQCHGGHQPSTDGQLIAPCLGDRVASCCCRDDGGVRRTFGITQHAIPKQEMQVGKPKRPQVVAGLFVKPAQPLHRINLSCKPTQHCRLITTASSDLQHAPQAPARAPSAPSNSSHMRATTLGLEMVCPSPIGRLVSS